MTKVYFSKNINSKEIVKLFNLLGVELKGNVAVKVHSGEPGNQNFLGPDLFRDIIERVNGTIVECNTAYDGGRNTSERHRETLKKHGWSKYFKVDNKTSATALNYCGFSL